MKLWLLTLIAFTSIANQKADLTKVFSVTEDPGRGALELKLGSTTENITLGGDSGKYGVGIVLTQAVLSEADKKEFPGKQIVQIALGNAKASTEQTLPQFASLTLVVEKIPTLRAIEVPITDKKQSPRPPNFGVGLIYSPNLKTADSDEEKLKSTFYLGAGSIEMVPIGQPQKQTLKEGTSELPFKKQSFVLRVRSDLRNPFNTVTGVLSGSITVPVFWPEGKKSEAYSRDLASHSSEPKP